MKRSRYPFYYLLAVFGLTFAFVMWSGWPSRPVLGWVSTVAVIVVCLLAARWWHWRGRRQDEEMRRILGPTISDLERMSEGLRENTPFVLVAGDHTAPLFSRSSPTVRQSDSALWVRAATPAELPHLAFELSRWRNGKLPEAIVLVVRPDAYGPIEEMSASLHDWRHAIADTARKTKRIPCFLSVYVRKHRQAEPRVRGWFGWLAKDGPPSADLPAMRKIVEDLKVKIDGLSAEFVQEDSFSLAVRAAKAQAALDWLDEMVLPPLFNSRTGLPGTPLQGLVLIDSEMPEHKGSAWANWQALKIGLSPRTSVAEDQYPLPFQLLLHLKSSGWLTTTAKAVGHCLAIVAVGLMVLLGTSSWHNRKLADRVVADVRSYSSLNPDDWDGKKAALRILEDDRRELYEYNLGGPPRWMGWGLYQGLLLMPPLEAAIAGYKPPPTPVPVPSEPRIVYVSENAPRPIVIDSVALFDSGKSQLKKGSEHLLLAALEQVQANPAQFFIVAGHTDNVGGQEMNQKLSEARAMTVRNWLVEKSGVPVTRFAIQGYGYVSPVAGNESEEGRARNRRVEITMVPTLPPEGNL